MNIATTDRTGPDDSPLTLKVDGAKFPKLGMLVCAQNKSGWNYIGAVTSIDMAAGTYTLLPIAIDRTADKIRSWRMANIGQGETR